MAGVRTALLESEDNECPECNEKGSSPGSLIPNRFLRNSVNSFKNETGYNKPRQPKSKSMPRNLAQQIKQQQQKKTNWNISNRIDLETAPAAVEENTQASNDDDTTSSASPPQGKTTTATAAGPTAAREPEATADDGKSPLASEREQSEKGEKTPHDGEHSRAETPHDESDFEDNITVTVPKPHTHNSSSGGNTNSYHDYRERQSGMNGRYIRPNINEMDSASNQTQSHQVGCNNTNT